MTPRHAVRSSNRQALIAATQYLAAASSAEQTNTAMAALREALVPYADRERTMRPLKAKPEPEANERLIVTKSAPYLGPYRIPAYAWTSVIQVDGLDTREVVTIINAGVEVTFETFYTPLDA